MAVKRIKVTDSVSLSRIAYGMWRIADDTDTSAPHIQAKMETCLEHGITTLDQADIYGGYTAESLLGAALKASPGLRNQFEIVTKCGIVAPVGPYANARVKHYNTSADHITAAVEASLQNLATDRIDLLLIHRPNPMMDPVETGRTLDMLVQSGKVRAVGVSNFLYYDIDLLQSHMEQPLSVNQIEMSLARSESLTNGELAHIQSRNMVPMAWSPLAGGTLFAGAVSGLVKALRAMAEAKGFDMATLAVAWLLAHPAGIVPVIGTNTLSRIISLAKALEVELDTEDWFVLYSATLGREVP